MAGQGAFLLPGTVEGPETNRRIILAAGGDQHPVRAEGYAVDIARVDELRDMLTGRRVPDVNGAAKPLDAAGGDQRAVRTEGHCLDPGLMGEGEQLGAGGDVPHAGGAVVAGGGDPRAIRAERDGFDVVRVPLQDGAPRGRILHAGGHRQDRLLGLIHLAGCGHGSHDHAIAFAVVDDQQQPIGQVGARAHAKRGTIRDTYLV